MADVRAVFLSAVSPELLHKTLQIFRPSDDSVHQTKCANPSLLTDKYVNTYATRL